MKMEAMQMTGAIVGAAVVMSLVWRVVKWAWLTPKRLENCLRRQGLTGNPYRPLFGDAKESFSMTKAAESTPIHLTDDIVPRVMPFFHQIMNIYGKNSFVWVGPTPWVNIMDPDLIKEIMANSDNYRKPGSNHLTKFLITGLINYDGDQWAKHRKIINPAFHQEKLKKMIPVYYLCAQEMVSKWEEMVSVEGSCELDVWPYLETLTSDVISRTAFGSNYEEGKRVFQLQKEQAQLIIKLLQSPVNHIPGWRFFPTKSNKRMKAIEKEVQALLKGTIHKREKAMNLRESCNDDLLGVLMGFNNNEVQEHQNFKMNIGLSIEEIIDECKVFYFAGQETTSCLLVWTMILLSRHPNWQARAREEVFQVFGNNKPNYDGINLLKTVTMILNEVLRLYPPAAMLGRKLHKDMIIGKLSLPKGVQLVVSTMLLHNDRDIWGDDVKEFNPERFSGGVSKATKNQASFIPFGWGPRMCIGQSFAMMEAKMVLSVILQHFSFELSPYYAHAPISVFTLQPQYGAQLILHKI